MTRGFGDWGGNIAAFLLVVAVNGMANAVPIGGRTTGQISAQYPTLFTPAGFTFSIWGLIYAALLAFTIYQALPSQRNNELLAGVGTIWKINCLFNAAWVFVWHFDFVLPSLLLMFGMLATLVLIYFQLNPGLAKATPMQKACLYFPFSLYLGWITVATIANISVAQNGLGLENVLLTEVSWTWIKLALAGAIGATVISMRADSVFILVIAWAALGIANKQAATPEIAGAAATMALLALMLALVSAIRSGVMLGPAR